MKKRSFFFKEYLTHFILIVVAFTLAGSVFYHQMASYALRAKQTELKTTVQSLAEQSKLMQGTDSDVIRELYMLSIARIAKEDELTVLVTNESGEVQMAAHPNGSTYSVSGYRVPAEVVSKVTRSGSYAAVGSVGVLTEATSYTVGSCVRDTDGNVAALIFVSCEDPATAGVVRHSTQTLVLILLVTLAAMLIISFILSQHITRPIKNIAAAAKEFASGNFDVRVPEDNHCYEIDELAVSFNNMARDLDQLEELTRGFISNVSHEFKTPMTTIGGFVDGMIDGTIPEEQRDKYLRIIAEETRRLSRMVNRMLDAAKIQSGELLLSPAPFDFSAMTSQIILSFEQKIEKKKLEVECELDDRLIVMGDRDHLYRAVYNLVDNAVKFIDEGGRLTLRAHPEGDFCAFSISNTGTGISAEDLPHVFDRFYKADRSRSMDKTGAGKLIADTVVGMMGANPNPYVLTTVLFLISNILTQFMSNTASAALLAPIGISIAQSIGVDPKPVLMALGIAASCAFATPMATPPNTLVLGPGNFTFNDYVKVGVPLCLISWVACVIIIPIFWPFH